MYAWFNSDELKNIEKFYRDGLLLDYVLHPQQTILLSFSDAFNIILINQFHIRGTLMHIISIVLQQL